MNRDTLTKAIESIFEDKIKIIEFYILIYLDTFLPNLIPKVVLTLLMLKIPIFTHNLSIA